MEAVVGLYAEALGREKVECKGIGRDFTIEVCFGNIRHAPKLHVRLYDYRVGSDQIR